MRIGELAKRGGVSVRSLRYYEEQGLLTSDRTGGGHREYLESDVERVQFMQLLYTAGMPSRRIVELLPFLDTGVATPGMIHHLDEEGARMQAQIRALTTAHVRLTDLREIAMQSVAGRPALECRNSAASAVAA